MGSIFSGVEIKLLVREKIVRVGRKLKNLSKIHCSSMLLEKRVLDNDLYLAIILASLM